jgi:hypothetical protein
MNMAKISIGTFLKWKRDTVVKESKQKEDIVENESKCVG